MPDQLQLRGGTTAQHTSFTGASKEVTVDTTKKTAVVHDGSTVGGVPLLREDGSNSALALGSQGTPSLKWDANTGIYSPGEDQLAVATNGTGRLFVDSNGLVGIGATPTSKLEVSHSGSNVVNLTGPANASLVMTGASVGLVLRCGGEATFGATTNDPLALITNNTERLRITSAGLVGIGTSSPGALLEASSATGSATPTPTEIRLSSTTNANDWSTTDPWARLGFYSADTTGGARLRGAIDTIQTFSNGNVSSLVFKLDDASTGLVERMRVTYDGKVGIGTTSPLKELQINATTPTIRLEENGGGSKRLEFSVNSSAEAKVFAEQSGSQLLFGTVGSERARIDSSGRLLVGTTNDTDSEHGTRIKPGVGGGIYVTNNTSDGGSRVLLLNRQGGDGNLIDFRESNTLEGAISVSGTTVTYGGGHLARWSQLPNEEDPSILLKGTVMSNLDEMCEWGEEDNEQLNKTKISDVEGDKNVAGVFVSISFSEDGPLDFFVGMTGDMVIRIAEGTTVERGDLLMSAGDGTAKPQADDIIRSKTIAKVTSTNVSCTYEDGSYCVPCVLMAC